MDLLQDADDSDGMIGQEIDEGFGLISEITEDEKLSEKDKESIFAELFEESHNIRYQGWNDWELNFLEGCSELAFNKCLRNKLENYLNKLMNNKKRIHGIMIIFLRG